MGADYRGLGIVRSLGRRGIPVWVLKHDDQFLAVFSRYARRSFAWQGTDEAERVRFLLRLASRHGLEGWVLFPTDDEAVLLVARHHRVLAEHFRLTTPSWDQLRWAVDKRLVRQLALELGVDHPWTYLPRSREELLTLDCPFPVILKPAYREQLNKFTMNKAWRVDDRRTLLARFDEACMLVDPDTILIQEMVPGNGQSQFSYSALCVDGRPVATVVARRTRQFPMDFGRVSTYVETLDEDGVVAPSVRLLQALKFTGMVEVEYKRDLRDGRYKLLDVNPRVWGWQNLCGRAGVDFPHLVWRQVMGDAVPEQRGRLGVRWVWMTLDLPMALGEILLGRLSLGAYLNSLRRPIESATFASDDPRPGLLELPLMAYRHGKRLLRGDESTPAGTARGVQPSRGDDS